MNKKNASMALGWALLGVMPAFAHPEGELTNAVAAHLAVHRVEHLVAINKLDPSFEKAFNKVSIEALAQVAATDPAFRAVVFLFPGPTASRLEILMDKAGKAIKETVTTGVASEGAPTWLDKSGITLTELATHSVLDAIESDPKLDEFIDSLTEVELIQRTNSFGQKAAAVDYRSTATNQVYEVLLGTDGTILKTGFLATEVPATTGNALTQEELLKVTKLSMDDYTTENPEHAKHISGFKVSTVAQDAKVVLSVAHEGMVMSANYFCVRQEASFVCTAQ